MDSNDVNVYLFAAAKAAVGHDVVSVPSGSFASVIAWLTSNYPEFSSIEPRCSYLLNATAVHGNPDIVPGDRLDVLPPFAGG